MYSIPTKLSSFSVITTIACAKLELFVLNMQPRLHIAVQYVVQRVLHYSVPSSLFMSVCFSLQFFFEKGHFSPKEIKFGLF